MEKQGQLVSATQIKNRFGDCLARVVGGREPLLIKRHGKPVAVLMDFRQWEMAVKGKKSKEQNAWVVAYKKYLEKMRKRHRHDRTFSAVDLIRQIRDEES